MAARKHPAAKNPATGRFADPWIVRGRRIYYLDPWTEWAEPERIGFWAGLKSVLKTLEEVLRSE